MLRDVHSVFTIAGDLFARNTVAVAFFVVALAKLRAMSMLTGFERCLKQDFIIGSVFFWRKTTTV